MYIGDGQQLLNNTKDHLTHNVHAEQNSSYVLWCIFILFFLKEMERFQHLIAHLLS